MQLRYSPLAVLSLASLASAVSLVDFVPRVNNLPPVCDKVYKETVSGCSGSDFGSSGCSEGCVKALFALVDPIKSACGNKDITGQNIIVAFLANQGPTQLCKNANDYASSSSSGSSPSSTSAAPDSSSSSSSPSSSADVSSTSSVMSSTSSASMLSTTSAAPKSTSSGGLIVDTSSTPTGTAPATATPSSKNNGSGGGSPFDTGSQTTTSLATGLSASFMMLSAGVATVVLAVVSA